MGTTYIYEISWLYFPFPCENSKYDQAEINKRCKQKDTGKWLQTLIKYYQDIKAAEESGSGTRPIKPQGARLPRRENKGIKRKRECALENVLKIKF